MTPELFAIFLGVALMMLFISLWAEEILFAIVSGCIFMILVFIMFSEGIIGLSTSIAGPFGILLALFSLFIIFIGVEA